jgi:hypothetical protein
MRLSRGVMCLLAGVLWLWWLLPADSAARDPMRAPPEEASRRLGLEKGQEGLSQLAFHFLRDVVSRVDGARCPMYPTDTQFALEAASRHGAVLGILFLVDRLFHEWSETKRVPLVVVHGRARFHDPLDANDFWLRELTGSEKPVPSGPGR